MNTKPTFRFGVNTILRSATDVTELAQKLEASGFSTLLTPDGPSRGPAVFPMLAHAASATTTLHVGTYVIANDLHHPFHLAHNAATLQTLSGGRFELGLGAGRPGMDAEYDDLGLTIGTPGQRLSRLERSAGIIRALLRGEIVNEKSNDYVMKNAVLPGWLTQVAPPPVMIAGSGPRLLDMAARSGDIVAVGAEPLSTWDELRGKFDRIAELARDREVQPEINMTLSGAGSTLAGYFARMPADQREALLNAEAPTLLWGSVEAMIEGIHRLYEQFGATYFVISEDLVETMIPVVKHFESRVRV
jgi:probable F420-dependent oxidoreductase